MTGPAKYGALVYSNNIRALAQFYTLLFEMEVMRETPELISLIKEGFNIVLHIPPVEMPAVDFNRVKLFITVGDLEAAKLKAQQLGGQSFEGVWSNAIFAVSNIADPEGNHIQLREFRGQP